MTIAVVTKNPLAIVKMLGDGADPIYWPDGTITHGTAPGYSVGDSLLVSVEYDEPPGEFYEIGPGAFKLSLNGSTLSINRPWVPKNVAATHDALVARLNSDAEAIRLKYITPGTGQAMVYMQKQTEAMQCLVDPSPVSQKYPLLAAAIGFDGATLMDVANTVMLTATQWTAVASMIEKTRLTGIAEITAAKTVDDAKAAYDAVKWQ